MRRALFLTLSVVLVAAVVASAGEVAWFDFQNCAMCKDIMATPGLVENVSWEQYNLANGIISVTTVDVEYVDKYRKAHAGMAETAKAMHSGGEMPYLCGSCTALGMCMMKGANQEYVETINGCLFILTSTKPELVEELQNWAKRNKEEKAKMKAAKG